MPPAQHEFRIGAVERGDPRFQRTDAAAADRHQIMVYAGHLDQLVVAGAFVADDAVDIDDVTAMNADKAAIVQPRFDVSDCERAKQLVVAVKDEGVVRVGVDRDDLLHGEKMRATVTLDRQMTGKAPRRSANTAKRRVSSATEFRIGIG